MRTRSSITTQEATALIRAAVAAGPERPVSIAVVDDAGALLAFERMEGARTYTVDLALQKARASAAVGLSTAILAASGPRDVMAGGVPILAGSACVGAIGVSGSSEAEDVRVAQASIDAVTLNDPVP